MSLRHQVWHQFGSLWVRGAHWRPLGPHLTPGCPLAPLNLLKVPTEITWRSYDGLTPWIASLCPPTPPPPPHILILSKVWLLFKALALWADAFYKLKCPSVCVFVCLFAPTFWSLMSNILRDLEYLGKSNGKKWSKNKKNTNKWCKIDAKNVSFLSGKSRLN